MCGRGGPDYLKYSILSRVLSAEMAASKKIVDPSVPVEGCYIFDKLPGEMRNKIWELSFTNNDPVADLRNPSPPAKSLLLTCKKTNSEARGLYKDAYDAYWTTSRFQITIPSLGVDGSYRWSAALHGEPEHKTWILHQHQITDLTIVLFSTEKNKAFKGVKESIFLDANGVCKVAVKLRSNVEFHWKGHTGCGIYAPRALPREVTDAWLRKLQDKGETEARLYTSDTIKSIDSHVTKMLQHLAVDNLQSALRRLVQGGQFSVMGVTVP